MEEQDCHTHWARRMWWDGSECAGRAPGFAFVASMGATRHNSI